MAHQARRKRRKERGTSLVEAAFITPVFLGLVFGIIEMGFLFRNYLAVNNATLAGARAASVAGDDAAADFLTIRTVAHGLDALNLSEIEAVVIYKAAGPNSTVPPGCIAGSSDALDCNRYVRADFFVDLAEPNGTKPNWECGPSPARDRFWCPTDRESQVDAVDGGGNVVGPDYVGVYVQVRHQFVTGFFGADKSLSSDQVIRIEPTRDK